MNMLKLLLNWFDRSREEEDASIPSMVTNEQALHARMYLEKHSGFDFESFEKSLETREILEEPLGPTSECLNAEDIAMLVESGAVESSAMHSVSALAERAVTHSETCQACFDNIALYIELKRCSLERAMEKDVHTLPPSVLIGSVGHIKPAGIGSRRLGLSLTMCCDASVFDAMDTVRAQIWGKTFDKKEVVLHRVESKNAKWLKAIGPFDLLGSRHSGHIFDAYYCTESLNDLDQVRTDACGFISIDEKIGGSPVLSGRVIRMATE
jgi:hypothetical protein